MEDIKARKRELRGSIQKTSDSLSGEEYEKRSARVAERLFSFANFVEAKTVLLYYSVNREVDTRPVIERCQEMGKIVLLPVLNPKRQELVAFKIDSLDKDLRESYGGRMEPDPRRCKPVPHRYIDLGIIPGVVFDERGGRLGSGEGYYDRLIPQLPPTTRKVSLALECQLVPQVPMEAHDRFVDIIITEEKTIYKI
jgi:5-formyltetrahydrofolate cyclo-ligase